ncbi:MAG TPA: alpha/beta hydrolase-fold protein [Myxococcaceae bacterium]|nr:alpha/beta hydrolase-fold protein [Myxococcaceae bacterium]
MITTLRRRGAHAGALLSLLLLAVGGAASATTIRVHYDVGWGNRITIRGNKAPLSWTTGVNATWTTGNAWTYSIADSAGDVEFKPLVNDTRWSTGANYRVKAGATVDVYPFFGPAQGTLRRVDNFYSPQLNNSRSLIIYLPPSYAENPLKRYPVLYMHDGQNLFDPSTSFGGVEWRVDETANAQIGGGHMDEVIVVGVYNAGGNRIYEYTPCCDPQYGGGGANQYEAFLLNTVKPYVDQTYRTLTTRENTAMMGSSLGGLVTFYIGWRNPAVFAKTASLSSSFWWNNRSMVSTVANAPAKVPARFYIDAGTNGDGLADTTAMRDALVSKRYVQGNDLNYYVADGANHSESAWAARLHIPLRWLFPWGSTVY